ncbi:MAG: hypothetical protein K2M46_07205 [Lachnospiraceae bacterium]|nr:hypothetical protein [Lachnospiraceae bacterium]
MKFLVYLKSELKQLFSSLPFWVCCILVTVLECSAGFFLERNGKELSVIETIITYSKQEMKDMGRIWSVNAFVSGVGSWLKLFVPVIASLPAVALYRDQASTGYRRCLIYRVGKKEYLIVKYLSGFLGGAITLTMGTLLFFLLTQLCFPSAACLQEWVVRSTLEAYHANSAFAMVMCRFGIVFLYGGIWASITYGLLGLVSNKYLIVGIPFMMKYIWQQCAEKWNIMDGDALLYFSFGENNPLTVVVVVYGLLLLGSFFLFYFSNQRKEDIGV